MRRDEADLNFYAALSANKDLIQFVGDLAQNNEHFGGLFSFGIFHGDKYLHDYSVIRNAATIADCGAITATTTPDFFLKNSIESLSRFYSRSPFKWIIEPDIFSDYDKLRFKLTVQRTMAFYEALPKDCWHKVIRPVHGSTWQERAKYFADLRKCLPFEPSYIAIGGIAGLSQMPFKDISKTIDELRQSFGTRGVHLLGVNSAEGFRFAMSMRRDLRYISVDGTSYAKLLVKGKTAMHFDQRNKDLVSLRLGRKHGFKGRSYSDAIQLLNKCRCFACTTMNTADRPLGEIAKELRYSANRADQSLLSLFHLLGQAHNLCMQVDYIRFLLNKR